MEEKNGIILLGLGPGDPKHLTREAWQILETVDEVYVRTSQHPTIAGFPKDLKVYSFDLVYEEKEKFEDVYAEIIKEIIELGKRPEGVVYAVPGHPFIAETTGPEIFRQAKEQGIQTRIVEGISFLAPVLASLGVDPLPQLTMVDAHEMVMAHHPSFPPSVPALIAQVHSKEIASELKITLMALYPDEHPVRFVHGAGTNDAQLEELKLYEIDQSEYIGLLSSLFIPPLGDNTSFEDFQELIAHLRSPEGCPWDREQTHQSLRTNLLEEAYEVLNAIDHDAPKEMEEEFGDLLLQIVLHAQIASEYGEFNMSSIIKGIHNKLVRRHPHVFKDVESLEPDVVLKNWEKIKAEERSDNGDEEKGILDGVPTDMPALAVADKYQKRAARVGFDWPEIDGVFDKIMEEIKEFEDAENPEEKAEEIGDLIFAVANLARWIDVDPETALRETNLKFKKRFAVIEATAKGQGKELSDLSLEEMDAIWEESKKGE
ncbi:MAG: nucleoside triphosphate pyrophosphohydrolase [Chloroflexi bacterium]|jgi:tetrapyrrole methylase family protein / MazG family protein|nr:nucleoside triphosphate pyrophosphohydrolase [Chloroflexota bacterium]MBT3669325.1 nucleoside triphosphate pyrophosphohydrolase [Chloroflexota bacterium]MBT4003476.1 nucleoside triphosphate pyrophosphohydrolase [Chloroflexota bacterium]MBT4306032.1 nucleoside triphosphate pyrophosphohydrolase [Chloroflexota bacterium]MBT4532676.1 nucleoside triphosphate pyrophosphohydrolase [Chloroflexota bacterium]